MKTVLRAIGLLLFPLLVCAGAAPAGSPAPRPDLSALEAEVAAHITEAREALDLLLSNPPGASALSDAHGSMAKLYHTYELHEAAEHHYREALRQDPLNFAWHYYLGRLLHAQGRLEQASAAYADALSLEPESALVLVRRGDVFLMQGQLEEAKANYLHAFYLHPRSNVLIERLGEVALGEQRHALALEYLLPAVQNQPEANRIHYLIGLAYRGLGETENARKHLALSGSVGLNPPDPYENELKQMARGERLYLLRGKMAYQAGHYQAAAEAFAKAVQAAPDSVRARTNLGTALGASNRLPEAIEQFRKALELDPGNTTASFNLGQLLLRTDRPALAIPPLQKTVQANPEDADAQLVLARAHRDIGEHESALEHFRLAALHDSGMENAWLDGAQLLLHLGRSPEALRVLEQAHTVMPDSGRIALALSQVLATIPETRLRDGSRALELAQRVFDARPNIRHAQALAMALAETGNCEQAAQLQSQLMEKLSQSQPDAQVPERLKRQLAHYRSGPECRPGIRGDSQD